MLILIIAATSFIVLRLTRPKESSSTRQQSIAASLKEYISIGEGLYRENCQACHGSFYGTDGPWLHFARLKERWPKRIDLIQYIRNSDDFKKRNPGFQESGYWPIQVMHKTNLGDPELNMIIDYIEYKLIKGNRY